MLSFLSPERLKTLIPYIFLIIILGFIGKLGYDNTVLTGRNERLREANATLSNQNNDLAATLNNLADKVGEQNEIVKTEARRRAAAEMKQQRLQDEVKEALRSNTCSVVTVPDSAADKLRKQAEAVRTGKANTSANTGKPAD